MNEPQTITATEASRAFSDLLHRVCYGGESFIIKKGQRLMARITPVAVVQETAAPNQEALPVLNIDEPLPDNVTPEEAEYFKTVIAQLRQSVPEPCE